MRVVYLVIKKFYGRLSHNLIDIVILRAFESFEKAVDWRKTCENFNSINDEMYETIYEIISRVVS